MKQLRDAFTHRHHGPPHSIRNLNLQFNHAPHNSISALLRKTGPFKVERDAYAFKNGETHGWPITIEDARFLRERYEPIVDSVSMIGIHMIRSALAKLQFAGVGLPAVAIDYVINKVTDDLKNELFDKLIVSTTGQYGRCGGMAFSALDFFLAGWTIDDSPVQPQSGELRQYIWSRLLDSLEKNVLTFFEWIMILHVLPKISKIASGALGAATGSVIGGPLGAAVGAFVGSGKDVLKLGGADKLLSRTKEHCNRLKTRLTNEAAWPIGLIYGSSGNPIEQHQVLAINYHDRGNNTAELTIWDNNDGRISRLIKLDFRKDQLFAKCDHKDELDDVKGIICEDYSFMMPPASLRRL